MLRVHSGSARNILDRMIRTKLIDVD